MSENLSQWTKKEVINLIRDLSVKKAGGIYGIFTEFERISHDIVPILNGASRLEVSNYRLVLVLPILNNCLQNSFMKIN